MRKIAVAGLVLAAVVLFSFNAPATCGEPGKVEIKPGMKVISPLAGPNWQVTKVDSVKGERIMVKDSDGGLGSVSLNEVVAHPDALYKGGEYPCFKAGDSVIAKAQSDIWRIATVTKIDGDKIEVQFMNKSMKTLKGNEIVRKP